MAKRTKGFANEDEPKVRVQLSIEQKQVDWLKRRNLSPSRILREAIKQLIEREQRLLEKENEDD